MCRTQVKSDVLPGSSVENPGLALFGSATGRWLPSTLQLKLRLQPVHSYAFRVRFAVPLFGLL